MSNNTLPANVSQTNVSLTNFSSENVLLTNFSTNFSSTNVSPTNVSPTDVSPTNVSSTNVSPTNVSPANVSPALSDFLSGSKKVKKSNNGGRPKKPIWRFYEKGDEVDKGHYVATYLACGHVFRPGKISTMEKHIIDCPKVDQPIREAVIYMVEAREVSPSNIAGTKHQIDKDQLNLNNFVENLELSKERKEAIDTSLIRAFVCCGLSWRLIEHPFFIEFLRQLRLNYNPPDRKTLVESFLTQEIVRVSVKLYRLLDNENNLTLGKNIFKFFIIYVIV